jgi:hypothetical protein
MTISWSLRPVDYDRLRLDEMETQEKAGANAREYRPYDAADRKLFPKLERLMKSKGVSLWPPHLALPKRAKSLAAAPWRAAPNGCAKLIAATGKPKKSNKRPRGTGGLQLLDSQETRWNPRKLNSSNC